VGGNLVLRIVAGISSLAHVAEESAMPTTPDRQALRDRFVDALLAATRLLQTTSDPEVALETLIDAAAILQDRLRQELAELRVEEAD
jgi:hypothetical protein